MMAFVCGTNPRDFCRWSLLDITRWGGASLVILHSQLSGGKKGKDILEEFAALEARLNG